MDKHGRIIAAVDKREHVKMDVNGPDIVEAPNLASVPESWTEWMKSTDWPSKSNNNNSSNEHGTAASKRRNDIAEEPPTKEEQEKQKKAKAVAKRKAKQEEKKKRSQQRIPVMYICSNEDHDPTFVKKGKNKEGDTKASPYYSVPVGEQVKVNDR